MRSIVYENLFLILLVGAGVLVCYRAYELYSRLTDDNATKQLAENITLKHLTTDRQFLHGFLYYLVPFLLSYLLLSVSPELLSLFMALSGTNASVGAMSISASEIPTFAPLLAATAVIALVSIKPFSRVETSLRRGSHAIAGVPQYTQEIMRRIRKELNKEITGVEGDGLRRTPPQDLKSVLSKDFDGLRPLNEWTFGRTGSLVWSTKASYVLDLARKRLPTDYASLGRKIQFGDGDSEEDFEDLFQEVKQVRTRYIQLLALLIANQDEADSEELAGTRLSDLLRIGFEKRAGTLLVNALTASTTVGFACSLAFGTLYILSVIPGERMSDLHL